ncbi:MAG: hydrogen peroxide-inducible genes activator [Bdellovibrionaceae bacterium]|nr:hydrogen peroxide-inducible genes activator [Pseudobdellovibrionaceae bacterium]
MTIIQLNYIVAVDKYKNFGVAAQSCDVTQPTLSMQIHKLEEQLGVILFDRSEQPIKTTAIGAHLVKQARIILRETQSFYDLVHEEKDEAHGDLRIGVIPTIAPYLMPLFLKDFMSHNPQLKIIVEELQTSQIVQKLEDSQLDVGLLVTPIEKDGLKTEPLFYEPFLAYVSEKSPLYKNVKVDQKDLNSSDLWLLTDGHCFREQSLLICKNRKKHSDENKNLLFESASLETLKRLIDQESGFTLLPYLATLDVTATKKLKEFSGPVPTREVSLIYNSYFRKNKVKESLIKAIQSNLPEGMGTTITKKIQVIDLPSGHQG